MHAPFSTAHSTCCDSRQLYTLTNDKGLITSWEYLLNTRKWLPAALHGRSGWQSLHGLPGRFPADDAQFEVIAKFLTPESLTFSNKSSPWDFWTYLRPLHMTTTDTSPRWVTCLIYMYTNERMSRKLNRHIILQHQVTVTRSQSLTPGNVSSHESN